MLKDTMARETTFTADKKENKQMDLQEFVDLGYLQEVNRMFFHPVGLALVVAENMTDPKGTIPWGIYDKREIPEGWSFKHDIVSREKAYNINAEFEKRASTRKEILGYITQPLEEEDDEEISINDIGVVSSDDS